jgi:hypothetical protein
MNYVQAKRQLLNSKQRGSRDSLDQGEIQLSQKVAKVRERKQN